ncbi:unnamed protein product [Arabidopsis thaliana]|uniref:Uncharacterized protein n=4 Tax=Arabidopsis TaxID=3701 RepID=A0A654FTR2_ARATH|nr:uncharacterized protein AT4G28068 [Arabidopsis thaliana]KAG7617620.1 hypothetical protein ISN45_At04g029640 [Arabidopsis thaliana x Arabidopsis arenosa]KAG7622078.1 hypothetical protein ISN44_As04g029090 [Arabidopsis suecica]AEE85433.1 hypothetical protein AT4G28068 [Arabidopsis thaliana]CAA0396758.1 unnamed protein product [Arabidopsis thaliana]VYS64174.1 unnamed protein product [Arabidopsis thaliana]|eukprot:NP_001119072.1 hypothetical protein AT4G28068 [Arabidopsis thaliana]
MRPLSLLGSNTNGPKFTLQFKPIQSVIIGLVFCC